MHEARLNRYDQFTTTVDGQRIHFLHVRSRHETAIPLFLTHGWPGSLVEFLDVIEPLADPADPSDAVRTSWCPRCRVTDSPVRRREAGWNPRRIAAAFGQIADRLGYQRVPASRAGTGARSSRTTWPNCAPIASSACTSTSMNVAAAQRPRRPLRRPRRPGAPGRAGGGYDAIQGTRPQTIGYLLDDSPAGLAAWIIEKFHEWCDAPDGGIPLTKDQMLTNVMVYSD